MALPSQQYTATELVAAAPMHVSVGACQRVCTSYAPGPALQPNLGPGHGSTLGVITGTATGDGPIRRTTMSETSTEGVMVAGQGGGRG